MDFAPHPSSSTVAWTEDMESTAWDIGTAVLSGVLLEVSAYPKPGLVAPRSMGSHRDMDLQSFMLSSAAIAPCFYACARAGLITDCAPEALLPHIRAIGRAFDARLLAATHGVNTQRGILFCAGLLAAAAGRLARRGATLRAPALFGEVAAIAHGLCARELEQAGAEDARTAGEILFRRFGALGVRGEVEAGFPTVALHGLPALEAALVAGHGLNRALVHTLISLIAAAEDSTVLWRGGPEALAYLKAEAVRIRALGGALNDDGLAAIERLDGVCVARNISPGGAADLLAVTVGVYLLEHRNIPESAMAKSHSGVRKRRDDSPASCGG
jgi:triphosphoribosyl-dephospho-CoA synthase